MNKKIVFLALLIGAIALAGGYWFSQQQKPGPAAAPVAVDNSLATTVIDFQLPDSTGKPRRLSDWSGKIILLNFWATWCPPCREEIPIFLELYEKYKDKGLVIVGVAIDKREDVLTFMDTLLIDYPVLVGGEEMMDMMVRYGNRIGALPYSVIIDRKGNIVQRQRGDYKKANLERLLDPLLKPVS